MLLLNRLQQHREKVKRIINLELQKYETEIIKINLEMIIVMKVYLFAKIQLTFQKNRSFL